MYGWYFVGELIHNTKFPASNKAAINGIGYHKICPPEFYPFFTGYTFTHIAKCNSLYYIRLRIFGVDVALSLSRYVYLAGTHDKFREGYRPNLVHCKIMLNIDWVGGWEISVQFFLYLHNNCEHFHRIFTEIWRILMFVSVLHRVRKINNIGSLHQVPPHKWAEIIKRGMSIRLILN